MSHHKLIAMGALALMITIGAGSRLKSQKTSAADGPGLKVEYKQVSHQKSWGDCNSERGCAEISVTYPEITSAPTPAMKDELNRFIMSKVLESGFGDVPRPRTWEEMADQFIKSFREDEVNGLSWNYELGVNVVFNGSGLLALHSYVGGFTGGAHGNYSANYDNFDLQTGKRIALSDLLAPGGKARLDAVAEKKFRAQKELSPGQNLEEAGYWFEGGKFKLNENFAIQKNGLLFYFNTYEIGPYVLGDAEIFLLYAEIESALKKDGPLKDLLADPASLVRDLCDPEREQTVFSCEIEGKTPKVLSVCQAKPPADGKPVLYYRFGAGPAELSYPPEPRPAAEAFRYQRQAGANMATLEFVNNGYTYRVKDQGSAHGVDVIFPKGEKTVSFKCREPVRGGLAGLGSLFAPDSE